MSTLTFDTLTEQYQAALRQFKASSGTHVDSILTLAKTVMDAEATLSDRDFRLFARKNDFGVWQGTKMPARLRTLLRIGRHEVVFRPLASYLPASLTALSYLSRHTSSALQTFANDGRIYPLMTIEDVDLLIVNTTQQPPEDRVTLKVPTPTQPDYSVAVKMKDASTMTVKIPIIPDGFKAPQVMSFIQHLQEFVSRQASTYDCISTELELSPDLIAALQSKLPHVDGRKHAA